MKLTLIIQTFCQTLIFILFSCQTEKQNKQQDIAEYFVDQNKKWIYEVELIDGISIPNWLKGVWQNTAESNTNHFITYTFNDNKLTIRKGLNFQGDVKFIEPYFDYSLSESMTDSTYLIEMTKNNNSIEYEFKLQSVEWKDEKVLTYSIVENGKLKRDHLTSINLVLSKI